MQYQFVCKNEECGKRFDIFAPIGTVDILEVHCPECKGDKIRRFWEPVHIHFKGKDFTKSVDVKE